MAPKNKKKNAFYFFMKEIKEIEERKGRKVTMSTLPNLAHPKWKQLSLAEREPYEEMARQYNKDPTLRGGKLASDGTRVEDNLREEEERQRLWNKMIQDVKRFCNSDCTDIEQFIDLTKKRLIYFMTFNIQCCTEEGLYIPVEVGIIEYSILHGIHREYTKIIFPGLPPTGYAGVAKQKSEDTHQINVYGEGDKDDQPDLGTVLSEIKSFINPTGDENYPPVFCLKSEINVTEGCLDWLCNILRSEYVFQVLDASLLLLELANGAGEPYPSYTVASDLLSKTSFDYHPSTRCDFHEEKDNHFCALAYSKKLCYLLSDAICKNFYVELTEKHIPARAIEEKSYTVHVIKEDPKKSSGLNSVRLDKTENFYQNPQIEENKVVPRAPVPRQPQSVCLAARMSNLNLKITQAPVAGLGKGRGQIIKKD